MSEEVPLGLYQIWIYILAVRRTRENINPFYFPFLIAYLQKLLILVILKMLKLLIFIFLVIFKFCKFVKIVKFVNL